MSQSSLSDKAEPAVSGLDSETASTIPSVDSVMDSALHCPVGQCLSFLTLWCMQQAFYLWRTKTKWQNNSPKYKTTKTYKGTF